MLLNEDIKIDVTCQGFNAKCIGFNDEEDQSVMIFKSIKQTSSSRCAECGAAVHVYDSFQLNLKDMPFWVGVEQTLCFLGHRYRCTECRKTFSEQVPLKYPGTRITHRAANWIRSFLKSKISVRAIQEITGIHWDTIRKIQREFIDEALDTRAKQLEREQYKPKLLAVDEFAIHKGHRYATCVMDLETGDILWVGKGRAMADFEKFFEQTDPSLLSEVVAVAMDMNASYNKLVEQHLPDAQIVYDRYHMQAQYGKEVLGVVRLDEARQHKAASKNIYESISNDLSSEKKHELKEQAQLEKSHYSDLKRLRWSLLRNSKSLSDTETDHLTTVLSNHKDLAVCYAMKEEMIALFALSDIQEAYSGWVNWFKAAKESAIPALVHFAELKEKRILGLVAHAAFPVSTGKLEGFNNKIKVAKRIGYGYRDDDFFFSLIRFLSLPAIRASSPNFS